MNGLLTDLYELTMAAGYFAAGKHDEIATFELTIRRLPRNRDFVIMAGLHRAIDYLLNLRFTAERNRLPPRPSEPPQRPGRLLGLPRRLPASPGDVFAVPEGTVLYEGQPVMNVRAPLIEGQIPETYLLSCHQLSKPWSPPKPPASSTPRKAGKSSNSAPAAPIRPKPASSARAPPISEAARAPATPSRASATASP